MHLVPFEFTKPKDDSDFEDMCARVYGEVFNDPLPKINGRQGQAQAGVDVFVEAGGKRFGIQCKRYKDGALKLKHVEDEVREADKKSSRISRLIVATTAASDARLIKQVHELSDTRVSAGLFPVCVEFWEDICRHIQGSTKLLNDYAPNAPGAAYHKQEARNVELLTAVGRVETAVNDIASTLPTGRPESVNKLISGELDHINELLKTHRYADAREGLKRLGKDLGPFDSHQKARWYLQRGICTWHEMSGEAAVPDFFKASEIYPEDDKMAAARVRALLLSGNTQEAIDEGHACLDRFPSSVQVWLTYANARLVAGDFVSKKDIPQGFENEPDVLQLVGWARNAAGDHAAALEVSQAALKLPSAGFFVRLAALSVAVRAALRDPVVGMHGLFTEDVRTALHSAKAAFEPWSERLFCVQAKKPVEEAVSTLVYGYLLLGEGEKAVALLDAAKEIGADPSRLLRAELDARRDLGQRAEIVELTRQRLQSLDDESLLMAAEAAGNLGDVSLTEEAAQLYRARHPDGGELSDMLRALCWVARSNAGPTSRAAVVEELQQIDLASTATLPLLLGGVRVLLKAGDAHKATAATAAMRVTQLVPVSGHSPDRILAADLLFDVGEHEKAAVYYASVARLGAMSELHIRLLECYVRGGARRKAKELLESFPESWVENDKARALAIDLGQQAGDWTFLEPIAERLLRLHPRRVSTWLFALHVALSGRRLHKFHARLDETPSFLEGTVNQTAQLARLELRYGRTQAGMKRLYEMYRARLDDVEAAEAYFLCFVGAPPGLPGMENDKPVVAAGSSVSLTDDLGGSLTVTIDPTGLCLTQSKGEFLSSGSSEAGLLLGSSVGDYVELPGGMGPPRRYQVKAITSSYRRLIGLSHQTITSSVQPPQHLMQVAIPQSAEGTDFSEVHALVRKGTERSKAAFQAYDEQPLTLGILGDFLGHNPLDLAMSWPLDGPAIRVCNGRLDTYEDSLKLLERKDAVYVVDGVTLIELVNLDAEEVLGSMPKVLVSTATSAQVHAHLEDARADRSSGRAIDFDGRLAYLEVSERDKAARISFLERVLSAIESYCEIAPAYGPHTLTPDFLRLQPLLPEVEQSVLLLAAERSATLFTIDGRLAEVAKNAFGLDRVWPQLVLTHALEAGKISEAGYSIACIKLFAANRSFTSVRAVDLLSACMQGGALFHKSIEQFKKHLQAPAVEFDSIASVCLQFLQLLPKLRLTFAAFGEMLSHLCEAAFRHPQCNHDKFAADVEELIRVLVWQHEGDHPYPPLRQSFAAMSDEFLRAFFSKVEGARLASRSAERSRPLRLQVLKCTKVPCIFWVKDVSAEVVTTERDVPEVTSTERPQVEAVHTGYLVSELTSDRPEIEEASPHGVPRPIPNQNESFTTVQPPTSGG